MPGRLRRRLSLGYVLCGALLGAAYFLLATPELLYLGVDSESADESQLHTWIAKELGLAEPPLEEEKEEGRARRPGVGSKRCSNRRARESGYRFRFPSFREGYGALIRARRDKA